MSDLQLDGVTRRFGQFTAVDHADLVVPQGRFVCLLGPSGCGKTTLMRMIAGLEEPSAGTIRFDGEDLAGRPVHKRDFGMVFQSLALFQHLSVGANIAYPLKIRGEPRESRDRRVAELLDMVRLPGIADRAVAQLSGGQRQRVAIARALAVSPKLFLLDEPLSALDAKLREAMQVELRQLQERLAITTIVVTHDQREAMTMADTIVVMKNGRIQQTGVPIEVYRKPANAFVADFLGQTNLLRARRSPEGARLADRVIDGLDLRTIEREATLSVRPESVRVAGPDVEALPGTVTFVREMGSATEIHLDTPAGAVIALATGGTTTSGAPGARSSYKVGETVSLGFETDEISVFPAEEGDGAQIAA